MADNTQVGTGTGDFVRDKDRSGVKTQIVGLDVGIGTGTEALMSSSNPLPIGSAVSGSGTFTAADAVVAAPDGTGTPLSGTSTAGSVVALAVPDGLASSVFLIKGLTTNQTTITIYFEASANSTNGVDGDWVEVKQRRTGTQVGVETADYKTQATGYFRGNPSGFTWVRARLVGTFTGTPTCAIRCSTAQGATFLNSGLPGGNSALGSVTLNGGGGMTQAAGTISTSVANTPGTGATASTSAQVVANVSLAGNATFHVVSVAFIGTLVFEASLDAGLNYGPVMAIREDGTGSESTVTIPTGAFYRMWTTAIPGPTYFRVRCSAVTSGTAAVIIQPGPFLIEPNPALAASTAQIGTVGSQPSTTGTISSPALATSSFTVLAANTARKGAAFYNDSTNVLYLALAATASTTSHTVQVPAGGYYELPGTNTVFTGLVSGISTVASGNVRVTELS